MVATARPQGDWLMFHSWTGHRITIGAPGFGGIGSNVYVTREDGTGLTALTTDPEGEDNFHAYFSPDGKQVVWTHINWNAPEDGGRGLWDVRLADFVVGADGVPRLANERIVRPDNGHFYETQWWAPDGSGFLYTESTGTAGNLELFFYRVRGRGPQIVHLTDDNPAWDEQAIFTPDGKNVIFMSTRDHPGTYNAYAQLAQALGLPAEEDYLLILPLFEAGFLQPILPEANDLYEIELRSGAIRRLTHDGDEGWISPEFSFDRQGRLLWTELKIMDGVRQSAPVDPAQRVQQEIDLLTHPPDPQLDKAGHGGGQGFEIVKRTRVGRFVR
jgi:hypothetical protein